MRWAEFAEACPELASIAGDRLLGPGIALLGTLRRDGSPRISPCEVFIVDGDLMLGMMWNSMKARDLLRDSRIAVHSAVTNRNGKEGDMKVYGRVVDVPEQELVRRLTWRRVCQDCGSTFGGVDTPELTGESSAEGPVEAGRWYRLARATMRRPVPVVTAAVAFLLLLAAPFLQAKLGFSDDRNLPADAQAREVSDAIRAHFSERPEGTMYVLADQVGREARASAAVDRYATRLSRVDGVTSVDAATGSYRRGRREVEPGKPVENSPTEPNPTAWLLRPVSSAARVGEHRAVT